MQPTVWLGPGWHRLQFGRVTVHFIFRRFMLFSDLALARRLEAAEGNACRQFALTRQRLFPESGADAVRIAGADVVFDGRESPVTQTFGLGLLEPPIPAQLDEIEQFFTMRGAPTDHEVCPFAGTDTLQLLCARGYRPIEISNALFQPVSPSFNTMPSAGSPMHIQVRVVGSDDAGVWSRVNARGWASERPELELFMQDIGALLVHRENSACFLAEFEGQPCAAAALAIHEGVALFAGASTLPEFRRRGLQGALLAARMRYAREQGCDLAMMVAEPGSESQRNAQRQGFLIAYTRTKWRRKQADAATGRAAD